MTTLTEALGTDPLPRMGPHMSATNEQLVAAAYDAMKEQILQTLEWRVRERDMWIQHADEETQAFWLKMRERGIPDRIAERDAYRLLADHIRVTAKGVA